MRKFLMLAFSLICIAVVGQNMKPSTLVKERKSRTQFEKFELFSQNGIDRNDLPKELEEYSVFTINEEVRKNLLYSTRHELTLAIPASDRTKLELELVEVTFDDLVVRSSENNKPVKFTTGRHFRGIIKGDDQSVVALSIFNDDVMGLISTKREEGNLVLGALEGSKSQFILYRDNKINQQMTASCGVTESGVRYDAHELMHSGTERALSDCVRLYYEVDDDIYTQKGGMTQTVNFVTGMHNQVAALYANESINVTISEIFVWTTTSPYTGATSIDMLNQFTAYRNGFNGDLAMLLSYGASGGVAYVNSLCDSNPDFRMGFSSIYSSYSAVPTYSWTVEVVTHEFGHLFGSVHTHDCAWNGNNTAIDGCVTPSGCANPGLPSGGGTIMSYCHLTGVGINFAFGFGTQPGNVIRNKVTLATCLSTCSGNPPSCTDGIQNGSETGVDCGGPDCPPCNAPCNANAATLTLVFDNYPGETSWNIMNNTGLIIYSGSGYGNSAPGSSLVIPVCLSNGCFTLNVFDQFGDGMCCNYGNGSYTLQVGSTVYASGGAFGASETTPFCLNNSTCSDGIQNGNETGVDCGGSCPPCATCNDGIQNGNETGVDCGGSCPPCATCNDGIQNGNETGVDCGGSCPPCATCNDGIQNGNETGVDCGGSCPPCATCNDGIQNGNETGVDCGGSCPPCATCNDGIQNGNETGVDCGGSCPPCATCNDGIQNGNETGVDCGGSCPPCATCNDGIQNGNETGVDCGGSCPPCAAPTCNDGIQNQGETGVDCGGPCPACPVNLGGYYFESGWDSWIDGGNDAAPYTGPFSSEGTGSIQLRDNSGNASSMKSPTYALSAFGSVKINFKFYMSGMENNEDFWLQYSSNNGSSWVNIKTYAAGSTYTNGNYYTITETINKGATFNFTNTGVFRFICDASDDTDQVYIDAVVLTATYPVPTCSDGIQNQGETGVDCGGPCAACPTCSDGIQNQGETGVDCGGPCAACPTIATPIGGYYFESGWDGWVDGGADAARMSGTFSAEGTWSIQLRDNTGNTAAMTSPKYSFATYASAKVEFSFHMLGMENNEDFWLQYSSNNGTSWTTVKAYARGTTYNNGVFYNISEIINAGSTFAFTNNAKFRFVCDASDDTDQVYIDAVVITAYNNPQAQSSVPNTSSLAEESEDLTFKLYPNPASDIIHLQASRQFDDAATIRMYDISGRKVLDTKMAGVQNYYQIDVSDLQNGLYHLQVIQHGKTIHLERISVLK